MMSTNKLHLQATLAGHRDRVWCVAWHPKGDILASSGGDKTIRLWQRPPFSTTTTSSSSSTTAAETTETTKATWKCIAILKGPQTRTIRSLSWSPDGMMLAAASFDATTVVWQLKNQHNQNQMQVDNNDEDDDEDDEDQSDNVMSVLCILEGHEHEVKSVAWSPDGKYLATSSRDKTAWVWDCDEESVLVADIECMAVLVGHSQDVKCAKWIPGTHHLCTASYDNTIRIWPCDEEEEDWPLEDHMTLANDHTSTVWSMSFEPLITSASSSSSSSSSASASTSTSTTTSPTTPTATSTRFVSCDGDAKLILWSKNVEDDNWTKTCDVGTSHDQPIYTVSWSTKGFIASAGGDDSICIYSPQDDMYVLDSSNENAHLSDINSIEWNPLKGNELVSGSDDYLIKIWEYR